MPSLPEGPHLDLLREALRVEAEGQRALLAGERDEAAVLLREASAQYRASWEAAGPESFGRLIGMLKAAVIGGDADGAAAYALSELGPDVPASPAAAYAQAIAALVRRDDPTARAAAQVMRKGSPPFGRAADAIDALLDGDERGLQAALEAIVGDFAGREQHLTGVPIADTALMLQMLAEPRGVRASVSSPLLP